MDMSGQVSIPKLMDTLNCLSRVTCVAFHPTALLLATGSEDGTVKLWKLNKKRFSFNSYNWSATCVATLQGHSNSVSSVAFHPTAPLLATSSSDDTAKLWQLNYRDLSNSPCVATLEGHSVPVSSVAFHPTAPLLATGSSDNTAKLWKIKNLLSRVSPQGGGSIIRHHKKRLSRKLKRYASKRIKKNRNRNKYQKSKKAKTKTKTKTRRYRKIR